MAYGHTIISSSPIDVNLAKQVNILLENLGVSMDKIIVDPTTGGLGYGMEYSYSVMERLRMAALQQGDDKLQLPVINNLGNEVWKCKEAKQTATDAPTLGDPERRGILMEAVGAATYLLAGSDILIMRHPEAIRLVKAFIDLAVNGGSAAKVAPITKKLAAAKIDYAALAPAPDLTIPEEKKAAPAKAEVKAAAAKTAAPAPAPKAETPKPAAAPVAAAPKAAAPAATPADKAEAKAEAAAAAKAKADTDAKAQAEAAAKAKADAEARAKADADAKAKAEADAKKKADADALAKREAQEEAMRQQRAKERQERKAQLQTAAKEAVSMTAATIQPSMTEKMLDRLNRIHRRF
jgi:acetyl-CoA decarbonylase/synthase complex subunit delta